ncbi:unnamed protein product [Prorocentrum cordatum]|uniref:Isopenicillin N synthase-like Fe(2+) 2OG dioxygenase domain-containing protein n=1 Tax=Prorocentrum cordatum TaxID=2364126 RepID=A0ABN9UE95_9DINO|nr:unnamed protein product [Polarella glacialis]
MGLPLGRAARPEVVSLTAAALDGQAWGELHWIQEAFWLQFQWAQALVWRELAPLSAEEPPGTLGAKVRDRREGWTGTNLRHSVYPAGGSCTEHTDYGVVTVQQSTAGGLEGFIHGEWHPLQPPEGCALVFAGDMLERLTSGRVRALRHRVCLAPPAADQPLGLHWNARVYNTFAVPILGYVAQLETPPAWLVKSAGHSLRKAARGPGGWVASEDLWALRESFGLTASFTNIQWYALAAKIRVVQFDRACAPKACFLADVERLREALRSPPRDHSRFAWNDWYSRSFILALAQAESELQHHHATVEGLRRSRPSGDRAIERDTAWRKDCQRTVYAYLAARMAPDPTMRLRAKLQRWELEDGRRHAVIFGSVQERTPAWQGRRASHLLQVLGSLSPPRVQAAVFSTLFNRWTTARRFQGRARCLFGCGDGSEDSIEHYCRCRAVRTAFQRKLRLDPGVFCNLHTFLLVNPRIRSKEVLSLLGLAIYAVYTCTNTMRHRGRCDFEVAVDAITQAVREGAKVQELTFSPATADPNGYCFFFALFYISDISPVGELPVLDAREKVARFMLDFLLMLKRPENYVAVANRITMSGVGVQLPLAHFAGLHLAPAADRIADPVALLFRIKFPFLAHLFLQALVLGARRAASPVQFLNMNHHESLSWDEIGRYRAVVLLPHNVHLIRTADLAGGEDLYALEMLLFVPSAPFVFQFIFPGSSRGLAALHRALRLAAAGYRVALAPTAPRPGEALPRAAHRLPADTSGPSPYRGRAQRLCPYRTPAMGGCKEQGSRRNVEPCPYGVYELEAQEPLSCAELLRGRAEAGLAAALCEGGEGPAIGPRLAREGLGGGRRPDAPDARAAGVACVADLEAYRFWHAHTDYALLPGLQRFGGVAELLEAGRRDLGVALSPLARLMLGPVFVFMPVFVAPCSGAALVAKGGGGPWRERAPRLVPWAVDTPTSPVPCTGAANGPWHQRVRVAETVHWWTQALLVTSRAEAAREKPRQRRAGSATGASEQDVARVYGRDARAAAVAEAEANQAAAAAASRSAASPAVLLLPRWTLTAASRSRCRADRRLRLATRRQAEVDAWGWWGIPWEGAYEVKPNVTSYSAEIPCEKWAAKTEPNVEDQQKLETRYQKNSITPSRKFSPFTLLGSDGRRSQGGDCSALLQTLASLPREELAEGRKKAPVITDAEADTSLVEDAAQQISAALESVEGAISSAVGAVFGPGEPAQAPCKKA